MLKRLPIVATLVVLAAVATMIGLGLWQLRRAEWKEALLASYRAPRALARVAFPTGSVDEPERFYFIGATASCPRPVSMRATAGRNRADQSGYSHIYECRAGAGGPGIRVDAGWAMTAQPARWTGGEVSGIIAPDGKRGLRLVADAPLAGLEPSKPPGPDAMPNNHRFYAAQWFFFAAVAALIYGLALRQRRIKP